MATLQMVRIWQNLAQKKSGKLAICKDMELKFGIETKFEPLS